MTVRVSALLVLILAVCGAAPVAAQTGSTRYISDETAITLREDKGMNAPVAALLKSGTKVELIEEDAASGYSKVRVAQGRDGWVLARYLSTEPAAREKLAAVQLQLAEQQARVRTLENENAKLRQTQAASGSRPPPAAAAPVAELEPEPEPDGDSRPSESIVMFTGAALFVAGLLAGLLIPLVTRPRARRQSTLGA